jgi:polysaccharide biosynthesis PFTS motif protein
VRQLDRNKLARQYLFNNSSWIVRPLWTYELEDHDQRVAMVFYSVNTQAMQLRDGIRRPEYPGYALMNWPTYMVWDEDQAQFIRAMGHERARILTVGPIPFTDNAKRLPELKGRIAAVFDVTAQRPASLAARGVFADYYSAETGIAFLKEVQVALARIGVTMLLKPKRDNPRLTSRKYLAALDELGKCPNVVILDGDIAAGRIIQRADVCVSLPFTSTGVYAHLVGKPSVYFDPTGQLEPIKRQELRVSLLQDSESLFNWLCRALNINAPSLRASAQS